MLMRTRAKLHVWPSGSVTMGCDSIVSQKTFALSSASPVSRWLSSSIFRFFRQGWPFSYAKHSALGRWSQLSLMETGEICRLLLCHSVKDAKRLSAVRDNAAAVHGTGARVSLPGRRESNTASTAKSSEAIARQAANAKRRWRRTALMQPNRLAIVPVSSTVHIKPA